MPRNALLRRYARRLGTFTPGQLFLLVLLALPFTWLVGEHLHALGERSRSVVPSDPGDRYRPGLDFYEAERRAAERAIQTKK